MFFGDQRLAAMREMILAEGVGAREKALEKLLPLQRGDFIGIFREMAGLPVTIRLLDPPLHEFLPNAEELHQQSDLIHEVARQVMGENGMTIEYMVGTMIELPRAALVADRIAQHAQFFSFGTNDLTQTTFGLSRDDSSRFLPNYIERKIVRDDPFQVLDRDGVGQLVRLGTERGRGVKPELKVGICGEHGGDPQSIAFCNEIGLDYVSCSPFRVPVARLAAAQAALNATDQMDKSV
jgi:pyruvate,orthophosphate dikinase